MLNQQELFPDERPGCKKIFRPWKTCPKTGKRIYPKHAKCFVMWVPDQGNNKA